MYAADQPKSIKIVLINVKLPLHIVTWVILVVSLVLLSACNFHVHPLERKAVNTITALVNPKQTKETAEASEQASEANLSLRGIKTENTLKYLRVRHRQGVKLKYKLGSRKAIDESHQQITVSVNEYNKATIGSVKSAYLFKLIYEKKNENTWRLTSIHVDY